MEYMESKMQDYYDAAEAEYNELVERLSPPHDWQQPDWGEGGKTHEWKNYPSEDVKGNWLDFSGKQRMILAANYQVIADQEHWD